MPSALVLAPLALAAVLGLSGVAKLRDVASTRSVLLMLRLPAPLNRDWVATTLPWGELALAALILFAPRGLLTWVAAAASLALMGAYWIVVARALRWDPRPSCGCFGRIGDQTITERTLVRNTVLVAFAVAYLVLAMRGESTLHVLRSLGSAWGWVLGSALVAALAVLVVGRSGSYFPQPHPYQALMEDPTNTPPASGSTADNGDELDYERTPTPNALLLDPQGEPHTLVELSRERAQLLVFVNCYCQSTRDTIAALDGWRTRMPALDVRFVMTVDPAALGEGVLDAEGAWRDYAGLTWMTLGLQASPSAVLLGADGQLAGGPVGGVQEVAEFADEIAEALSEAPAVP